MTSIPRHRRLVRGLQLAVAATAFAYVLSQLDAAAIRDALTKARWPLLIPAAVVALAGLCLASLRWVILLRSLGIRYSPRQAFRCYLAGSFYGLAMPGAVGGDLARMLLCQRQTGGHVGLIGATVLLERMLGVTVLFCVLATGLALASASPFPDSMGALVTAAGAGLLAAILLTPRLCRYLYARALPSEQVYRFWILQKVWEMLPIAGRLKAPTLIKAVLLSAGFQFADLCSTWVAAAALGITLDLPALFVALPIAYLVTALPVSPAGLGLREAAFTFSLSQFGTSTAEAALLALGAFSIRVAIGLLGGVMQVAEGAWKLDTLRTRRPE